MVNLTKDDQRLLDKALDASTEILYELEGKMLIIGTNMLSIRLKLMTTTLRQMVDDTYRNYVKPGLEVHTDGMDIRYNVVAAATNLDRFFATETKSDYVSSDLIQFIKDTLDFYTRWRIVARVPFIINTNGWLDDDNLARTDEGASPSEIKKRILFLKNILRYDSDDDRQENIAEIERLTQKLKELSHE